MIRSNSLNGMIKVYLSFSSFIATTTGFTTELYAFSLLNATIQVSLTQKYCQDLPLSSSTLSQLQHRLLYRNPLVNYEV